MWLVLSRYCPGDEDAHIADAKVGSAPCEFQAHPARADSLSRHPTHNVIASSHLYVSTALNNKDHRPPSDCDAAALSNAHLSACAHLHTCTQRRSSASAHIMAW